jgi:hypothetical protein
VTTAIQPRNSGMMDLTLQDTLSLGKVFAESGYFADARQAAQCVVKILYGRELGIGPTAAMMGVHIIEGKPSPSSNLMATLIKRHPRYDYRVRTLTPEECVLEFFQDGQSVGTTNFSIADARKITDKAGNTLASKANWRNYPEDLLFARAISRGARRFCADVFGGAPVYSAEELGADVTISDTGEMIVDSTAREVPADVERSEQPQERRAPHEATPTAPTPIRATSPPAGAVPESAGVAFKRAASTAGLSEDEQKALIKQTYPGRGFSTLTADEWHALELKCRAMYSDVPAPEEAIF